MKATSRTSQKLRTSMLDFVKRYKNASIEEGLEDHDHEEVMDTVLEEKCGHLFKEVEEFEQMETELDNEEVAIVTEDAFRKYLATSIHTMEVLCDMLTCAHQHLLQTAEHNYSFQACKDSGESEDFVDEDRQMREALMEHAKMISANMGEETKQTLAGLCECRPCEGSKRCPEVGKGSGEAGKGSGGVKVNVGVSVKVG